MTTVLIVSFCKRLPYKIGDFNGILKKIDAITGRHQEQMVITEWLYPNATIKHYVYRLSTIGLVLYSWVMGEQKKVWGNLTKSR